MAHEEIIARYRSEKSTIDRLRDNVVSLFTHEEQLIGGSLPVIHSIKSRLKSEHSLIDKVNRKVGSGDEITAGNLLSKMTDLCGVRILHLHQDQFDLINSSIAKWIASKDLFLREQPVAYSWDPESRGFYERYGHRVEIKDSYYTSVHYVVSTKDNSEYWCEIQVRTLFEEIWGEIDHAINYPHPNESLACREQLKVLSRLVSTGSRLSDAIFRIHREELNRQ